MFCYCHRCEKIRQAFNKNPLPSKCFKCIDMEGYFVYHQGQGIIDIMKELGGKSK